jgi:isoquinoline 1-oxidoreductase subunit beta
MQQTDSSWSIRGSFPEYREFGARMRALLASTTADRWRVRPEQCRTEASVVYGPSGQKASYGELAEETARRPIPDKVVLKDPTSFRLIGKPIRRLDGLAKCNGSQKFSIDTDLPGMRVAVIARPPVFGATVEGFDDKSARSIAGVHDIFEIPLVKGSAIAVVADRFWTAKQARELLKIQWNTSGIDRADSAELRDQYRALARITGKVVLSRGDDQTLSRIPEASRIDAEYDFPYLAHAPMELLDVTLRYDGDSAEAWVSSQFPSLEQAAIAEELGLQPRQVNFQVVFAGGGFGRRATLDCHLTREAARIAKRFKGIPIKLMFTREDDMRSGYYRAMAAHRVEVGIGADGIPAAWRHVVVSQ